MRIFIVLLLLIAWYFFSWTYIDLRKNSCCEEAQRTSVSASPPLSDDPASLDSSDEGQDVLQSRSIEGEDIPVAFRWTDEIPVFAPGFLGWRDSLNQSLSDGEILELRGLQYRNERTPGLARKRAAALKRVLSNVIPADQIIITSENMPVPVPSTEEPFAAVMVRIEAKPVEVPAPESTKRIYFSWGNSQGKLSTETEQYFDVLSRYLIHTDGLVRITGHTDNSSSSDFNKRLGARRANAIRAILIQKGVPAQQIRVESKGESEPVASNDTAEGRRQNRRVEIEIISQ